MWWPDLAERSAPKSLISSRDRLPRQMQDDHVGTCVERRRTTAQVVVETDSEVSTIERKQHPSWRLAGWADGRDVHRTRNRGGIDLRVKPHAHPLSGFNDQLARREAERRAWPPVQVSNQLSLRFSKAT